jgi:hypothetical protein
MIRILIRAIVLGIFTVFMGTTVLAQKDSAYAQAKFRSDIRYLTVYNDIFEDERRIQVLLNSKSFNETSITHVFNLIKRRYPEPTRLSIDVETSIEMIETPEERDLHRDGNDSRFSFLYGKYQRAGYSRFENGREAFDFTVSLSPYRERTVVLAYETR